jgi:HPt (histidine-containing phosphotransfer) domain-containing protein
MLTIEKLQSFGADTKEGLHRCCGNESLYLRLVKMAASDACFDTLARALDDGDIKAAFSAAHTLKGVLGNLSLTSMFHIAAAMTETLRSGSDDGCRELASELFALRDELLRLCED